MKSKLEIYALAVCFVLVICLVISFGVAGYAIFKIYAPGVTMKKYYYDMHQTNEAYSKSKKYSSGSGKKKPVTQLNDEELTKQRLDAYLMEIKSEKRDGIQSLVQCIMFILASVIALTIHWIIAKKSRTA